LVVFRDGDEEEDSGDILETVDPLLSFRTLTTDVKHAVGKVANDESSFGDTGSLDTRAKHVLVVGDIVWSGDSVDGFEVAKQGQTKQQKESGQCSLSGRVVELIFAGSLEARLNTSVFPKGGNGISNLGGQTISLDLRRLHENGLDVIFCGAVLERQL